MSDIGIYSSQNPAEARPLKDPPPRAGNAALWYAVFAPPAAWTIALLLSIASHHDYCAAVSGHILRPWSAIGLFLTLIALFSLLLSLSGGLIAMRAHASAGSDDGLGNTDLDRRRFMARAGLLSAALFSYGIVLIAVAPFMIPAAWCR